MSLITMNNFIHDSINRMMNTYTMDLIRLFADKHGFKANEAYDAFMNSLRNNKVSLSKTESKTTVSEPALSQPEPPLSEHAVVDTEKSANKGRPKKVKENIVENHEDSEDDEESENVNTVIKRLMESDDNEEVEADAEEEIEVFQSEELIEYTTEATTAATTHEFDTPAVALEKEEDKKTSIEKEEKAVALKNDKEEKAVALKKDKEEKAAALKREKEEKAAALKKEKEDKAAALKKEKEEKAAALKREKEDKAAALKREKEDKKTSEKKKTTKKNEKTEERKETEKKNEKTEDNNTEERKETTHKKEEVITTHDITLDLTEEEYQEEDEQPLPAKKFTFKGKVYLKGCDTNVIYDKDTQEVIGEWEEKTNTIYFVI